MSVYIHVVKDGKIRDCYIVTLIENKRSIPAGNNLSGRKIDRIRELEKKQKGLSLEAWAAVIGAL